MKGGPTLTMPPTWKPQLRGYTIGWGLGYVQPTSPKEDTVPSRDNKTLSIYMYGTAPANRGLNQRPPGATPPLTAWKPQPHVRQWLGVGVRKASCTWGGYNTIIPRM